MSSETQTALVLGGTGKTGRRVAERLWARNVPVRVGSRSGEPPFDWEERDTWEPALRGTHAAYISFYPDLAVPGAAEAVGEFARLAAEHRLRRLVLLSGRGEPEAQHAEQLVLATGPDVTVVRCSWFDQNFSEDYLRDPLLAGEVALPAGDVPEPFVDADDIADVAVAALTEDGHAGEIYELTGPRLLTFAEAIAEIADASGRPIAFVPVMIGEYASALAEHGVPDEHVSLLTYLFTEVLDGRNAHVTDGVQRALGREPGDTSGITLGVPPQRARGAGERACCSFHTVEPTLPEAGAKPVIRPPRRDELERLRAIERAAGRLFLAVGMPEITAGEPLPIAVLDSYRTRGWAWVVTVDAGGTPAGYVVVGVIDDPARGAQRAAHVEQVSVDPAHGGLGLGRRLLDHVAAVARQRRLDAVTLTTFRDVPWNAPYYERCGFRALAEDELGAGLRRVRDAEAAHGLDPAVRVCMFRKLM